MALINLKSDLSNINKGYIKKKSILSENSDLDNIYKPKRQQKILFLNTDQNDINLGYLRKKSILSENSGLDNVFHPKETIIDWSNLNSNLDNINLGYPFILNNDSNQDKRTVGKSLLSLNTTTNLSTLNLKFPNSYPGDDVISPLVSSIPLKDQNIDNEYDIFSPSQIRDYSGGLSILPQTFGQPFIIIKPNDSNIIKYKKLLDSRTLPVGSTAEDIYRIGKWEASTTGILWNLKQIAYQQKNAQANSRIFNPLSMGSIVPGVHISRVLAPNVNNLYLNWIKNRDEESSGLSSIIGGIGNVLNTVTSAVGLGPIAPPLNFSLSEYYLNPGLIRGFDGGDKKRGDGGTLSTDSNQYTNIKAVGAKDGELRNWKSWNNSTFPYLEGKNFHNKSILPDGEIILIGISTPNTSTLEWLQKNSYVGKTWPLNDNKDIAIDPKQRYSVLAYGDIGEKKYGVPKTANNFTNFGSSDALFVIEKSDEEWQNRINNMGNPGAVGLDRRNRKNVLPGTSDRVNLQKYGTEDLPSWVKDFIPFKIYDLRNKKYIIFRATITGMSDSLSPEWNTVGYVGRANKVYTYTGAERQFSFDLKVVAYTRDELKPIWTKLNYIMGLAYPSYTEDSVGSDGREISGGTMIAPFIQLTVGDILKNTAGFFNNISITYDDDFPWELENDGSKTAILPTGASIGFTFTVIGDRLPTSYSKHYYGLPDGWIEE